MKLLIVLCLVACATASPFIVGGEEADVGEFPWQGSLMYNGGHTCGCVLISPDWALTAAHCTDGRQIPGNFLAWFGVHDRRTNQGDQHAVSSITQHPDFINLGAAAWPNDIALLELTVSADESDPNIQSVPISSREVDFPYSDCMISGWGRTCGSCSLPFVLMKTPMNVLTQADCSQRWNPYPIDDYHICILSDNLDAGSCNGDSGGPLVCESPFELCGITSWGASGCGTTTPSVYSRPSVNCGWITSVSGVACM